MAKEAGAEPPFVETDAAHSDHYLRIPEPMVYDLVRPLGVRKGELEVNALMDIDRHHRDMAWAPELEYGFADGYALEIELPFENLQQEKYKFALQKTLGTHHQQGWMNGIQAFVSLDRRSRTLSGDLTYIHAQKWSTQWSSLSMVGIRGNDLNGKVAVETLLNNTVFYDVSQRVTLGLELNHEVNASGRWRYRVTPQLHVDINQHYTVQVGIGFSNLDGGKKEEDLLSMRLIRVF